MKNRNPNENTKRRLSQLDAFFVAYQEEAEISMQLGVEVTLAGCLSEADVERGLAAVTEKWPQLGQTIGKTPFGLRWRGPCRLGDMLATEPSIEAWRDSPLDPFRVPPFQVLWKRGTSDVLAFRAHHAVADGQSFMAVAAAALAEMTGADRDDRPPERAPDLFAPSRVFERKKLGAMWRAARDLVRESSSDSSMRLRLDSTESGGISVSVRELGRAQRDAVVASAAAAGASPALYVCAAWMAALGRWNRDTRGENDTRRVSIEMPISARRGEVALGNFISPVVLFADSTLDTGAIAKSVRTQFRRAIADRAHLAVPLFTAPGRYLPWWLFRRVGANTAFSGFATSHYAWLDEATDIRDVVAKTGVHQVDELTMYTPVCRHMGAALSALPWPDSLQLTITYRRAAMSANAAEALLSATIENL